MLVFSRESAQKIADVTRLVARRPKFEAPRPKRPEPIYTAKHARTVGIVTALAGTTLGRGLVELLTIDRSGSTSIYRPTGAKVPVENMGGEIANGRLVQIKRIDGAYAVDVDYC